MKLCLLLTPTIDRKWHLARQMGVNHAVAKLAPELTGAEPPYDFDTLRRFKTQFDEFGLKLIGLEGDQFNMQRIKIGQPGRDEDIELFQRMLRNMGRLGLNLFCYNFMAVFGWTRTSSTTPARGGAFCSSYSHELMQTGSEPEQAPLTEETLWENYTYFLRAVLPVAEESGVKLALHPDDPPITPIRGIGRIMITAEAFRRVFSLSDSPSHGAAFCQATFSLMEDVPDVAALAEEFVSSGRVHYVHMRPVEGDRFAFHELFHDEGSVDFAKMLSVYQRCGFTGPLRPDHAPAMYEETAYDPDKGALASGYEILGRMFAVGYLKGTANALSIPLD